MLLFMPHNIFPFHATLQPPSFSLRCSHRSTVVSDAQLPHLAQPRIRRKWEIEDCLLLYSSQYHQPCKNVYFCGKPLNRVMPGEGEHTISTAASLAATTS